LEDVMHMDFPTALRAAREQLGMTQAELGKELHVSFSTINRYENGHHMPTPIILDAINALFKKNKIPFVYDEMEV